MELRMTRRPVMTRIRSAITTAAIACLVASSSALGADFDARAFATYGGTWSLDCASPAVPHLLVTQNSLVVEQGNKRMTGTSLQDAVSYFGPNPPKNLVTTLLAEVRGREQLLFMVYRDKAGLYVQLDGDNKVMAALGKALTAARYRRCAGGAPVAAAPAPSATTSAASTAGARSTQSGPAAASADPARDPKFRALYRKALGARAREPWFTNFLYGDPIFERPITIDGIRYQPFSACKPHDCHDHNALLLYSEAAGIVYGKVFDSGATTLLGSPGPRVAAELNRLWVARFRQQG